MSSDLRDIIRKTYRDTVASAPINTELKRSLKAEERIPVLIDNLTFELNRPEFKTRQQVEEAVRSMTFFFIQCVERKRSESVMSRVAKMLIRDKARKRQELEAAADALDALGESHEEKTRSGVVSQGEVSEGHISKSSVVVPEGIL